MSIVDSRDNLSLALKSKQNKIVINDKKIVKNLKLLNNIDIKTSDRNRCKYTIKNKIADSAFLGSIGFAPMISGIANISFLQGIGIISSIGLNEILIIFSYYSIYYEKETIILNKIEKSN